MKKIIALGLCAALLLLAGCGGKPAPTPTPEPTPEVTAAPTPTPTPTTTPAEVITLEACAVLAVLERGEQVLIVDEWEGYYIVDAAAGRGYVEKRLLAKDGEPEYEPWTAYAKDKAEIYESYHMGGSPERVLDTNTELEVLADLGDCYLVSLDDALGYVPSGMVSESRIEYRSWGGGGGGGAPSGGADGGDISLGKVIRARNLSYGAELEYHESDPEAGTGERTRVIAGSAELIAAIFHRGDTVNVFSQDGDICTLYIDGVFADMEKRLLLTEGEQPYESRTAYAASGAEMYGNFYLAGEPMEKPGLNTELTILADMGDCYLISLPDQRMGYIAYDHASDEPIVYNYYGGGGGGSSGGEWTEPAL